MNKQGKNKIEYLDYTWNPITGCLHPCKDQYCYANKIATRFAAKAYKQNKDIFSKDFKAELNIPVKEPYPYGFLPTFHKYRLNEPAEIKKPSVIGVVYMGDLFGEWAPDEWIDEVYQVCFNADRHTYMFLTKNPKRYREVLPFWKSYHSKLTNMWFGTTITDDDSFIYRGAELFQNTGYDRFKHANRFLSIEPLLGEIKEHRLRSCLHHVQWVIIGQQTGAGAIPPKDEWVQSIIEQCKAAGVPVFIKNPLYAKFPIQEWPEGLRKEAEKNG